MSVLQAPQTWIAAAAVLVVVAVVLIVLAPRRRGGSTGTAGTGRSAAVDTAGADTPAADDGDPVTAPVPSATTEVPSARAAAAQRATDDDAVTTETPPWVDHEAAAAIPATPPGGTVSARARRYVAVTDPARADERAKDRLLAVLLADPTAAVDVVAAMPESGGGASGASAAALLRAGLSPTQVAGLCGVDERDLADLVARDLGLLEVVGGGRDAVADQQGRSRTEEPGRAWASAGSASSSTTPTTG